MKKLTLLLLTVCMLCFSACGGGTDKNFDIEGNETTLEYETKNPVVAMNIGGYGKIIIELYPDIAPETVNNFIYLVKTGFYDNNTFHRLVNNFVLQGGDPAGQGYGGPNYSIKGEFTANGFENDLKHTEGILSMARSQSYDSAGSQFFIVLANSNNVSYSLDGKYAAFGKVVEGMDIIKKIASSEKVANAASGKLVNNLTIEKAVVDTKGVEYPEPNKLSK